MIVRISMNKEAWISKLRQAVEECERPGEEPLEFYIHGRDSNDTQRVDVVFDNDDMEHRDDVGRDACFVTVEQD